LAKHNALDTSLSQAFVTEAVEKGEFMSFSRFAIYYLPPEGPLADFGASWLGWDVVRGQEVRQLLVPGLHDITMTPRRYGFHGTLKPPFRLVNAQSAADLEKATAKLAASLSPAVCDGLELTLLGGFLALTPQGDTDGVQRIAQACIRDLDSFRAPADASELARRRAAGLSARQDALLLQWGYPYVMEEFRFHLTLSGRLPETEIAAWAEEVRSTLPDLPAPFVLDQIALCGERSDGRFEMLHRYTLDG
jgi:putative phosphonate metabolism protein